MKPRATLRLQLHAGFTFDDAAAHVGYFARLGVSHLYLSPITAAEPGSRHGYDVIDYSTVNPELGGEAAFVRLIDALRRRGMGAIVDIVPNHMGVGGSSNRWWNDVLEWGARSRFARHFDIDWHASDPALQRKVLLPCLGRPYGEALAAGDIALRADAAHGRFAIACAGRTLPVQIGAYPDILRAANRSDLNALAERFDAPGARPSNHARLDAAHAALRDYAAARGRARSTRCCTASIRASRARARCCTACSSSSITAWRGGAPPPTKSTGAAFSTSRRSPACASRTQPCSTTCMRCCGASTPRVSSTACGSITSTGSRIRADTAGSCAAGSPRCATANRISSSRRSSRPTNACPKTGASTARQATTS
ncbi:unnamed protein product [Burkholderia pseudomallei]|nr:unnamed protein product [Burkholderia pseudomallei]